MDDTWHIAWMVRDVPYDLLRCDERAHIIAIVIREHLPRAAAAASTACLLVGSGGRMEDKAMSTAPRPVCTVERHQGTYKTNKQTNNTTQNF
eukprot:70443-Prorocentrum_minimum.AAC.1